MISSKRKLNLALINYLERFVVHLAGAALILNDPKGSYPNLLRKLSEFKGYIRYVFAISLFKSKEYF